MSKGVMKSSFMKMEEEMKSGEKAGIGSILKLTSGEGANHMARPSLRRTFSADMSSRKWMEAQTLKKVPSQTFSAANHVDHVHEYSSSSSEDEEEVEERRRKSSFADLMKDLERPKQADVWSSIQSQKPPVPRPYIRPLVKSCTSPSQCSLEMCTESLGSETGAVNGCWQDLIYQFEEEYEEEKMKRKARLKMMSELNVKKCPERDFPPPLSSDSSRMQMRTHRIDGRLVVAAVPVSNPVCLRAERQHGRLLLTMAKAPSAHSLIPETDSEPVQHKEMKIEVAGTEEAAKLFGTTCQQVKNHKLMLASPRSWSTATILDMDIGEERLVTTKTTKVAAMGMLPQLVGSYETGLEQSRRLGMASARPGRALPITDKKYLFGSCKETTARILMWMPNCIATT